MGSVGQRIFMLGLLLMASRVFLSWGSGRSSTRLASGAHAGGGGTGTGGLFSFFTDSSCRRIRVARLQGRGGGFRRDDRYCNVLREVALRRPRNGLSGGKGDAVR